MAPRLNFRKLFFCAVAAALLSACASAPRRVPIALPEEADSYVWSVYETSKDSGRRIAEIPPPGHARELDESTLIEVFPERTRQEIMGFGGALTESSAWVLAQLPAGLKAEVLRGYFDPEEGLRYSLCRTHIGSCDFSLSTWSLDDSPGDFVLERFSLEPMRRWLLPLIHEANAASGGKLRIVAAPWSPPAWMKTNGTMRFGGKLRPECREAWAGYLARFATAMRDEEGLPIWALSVQNEPTSFTVWESCNFTSAEEGKFLSMNLGPAFSAAGLGGVRFLVWDFGRGGMMDWASPLFGDPEVSKYAWGTAFHWYGAPALDEPAKLHAAFPDKPLVFTEGSVERMAMPGRWDRGEIYARNMISDFRNYTSAWIDWNIALDRFGGPNHVGNLCDAPVLVDLASKRVIYQSSYYYIGQFSRFVDEGAFCVASEPSCPGLESVSFVNPDGVLVTVVLNRTGAAREFCLRVSGSRTETRACSIPAHAIQTYVARPSP
jgi:glucosylceramidase